MSPLLSRALQVAWEIGAVALIVGTILTVRKARARGKRLFVDQPNAVLASLKHDRTHTHERDML